MVEEIREDPGKGGSGKEEEDIGVLTDISIPSHHPIPWPTRLIPQPVNG